MDWRFWEREEEEDDEFGYETYTRDVSMPTLARWYLYDTGIENPNQVAISLGLFPTNEDGEEQELLQSAERCMQVQPYLAFIKTIAQINAVAMADHHETAMFENLKQLPEEERETAIGMMQDLYGQITYIGIYSALAAGLELGLIVNPGTFSTTEMESDNE